MAISCGFYNSIDHDRVYDAVQFGEMFDGLINDGVYATIGDGMTTIPASGMAVSVKSGRAWFNKTWTVNTSLYTVSIPTAHVLLPRIDAVILEIDTRTSVRDNTIKVISGTAASNPSKPTLTRANGLYQYPLAWVTVPANARSITNENIEIQVGRSPTPFVTGCAATLDISEWWNQWSGQFNTKLSGWDSTFNTRINGWNTTVNNKINGWTGEFNTDQADREKRFEDWFEEVKDIIGNSGDGSANLAGLTTRVTDLEDKVKSIPSSSKLSDYDPSVSSITKNLGSYMNPQSFFLFWGMNAVPSSTTYQGLRASTDEIINGTKVDKYIAPDVLRFSALTKTIVVKEGPQESFTGTIVDSRLFLYSWCNMRILSGEIRCTPLGTPTMFSIELSNIADSELSTTRSDMGFIPVSIQKASDIGSNYFGDRMLACADLKSVYFSDNRRQILTIYNTKNNDVYPIEKGYDVLININFTYIVY